VRGHFVTSSLDLGSEVSKLSVLFFSFWGALKREFLVR